MQRLIIYRVGNEMKNGFILKQLLKELESFSSLFHLHIVVLIKYNVISEAPLG